MLPAVAVPVKVSVLSFVMLSPTVPLSVENELIVGAFGTTVSTVMLSAVEAALTLPAESLAVAVTLWVASANVPVVEIEGSYEDYLEGRLPPCRSESTYCRS